MRRVAGVFSGGMRLAVCDLTRNPLKGGTREEGAVREMSVNLIRKRPEGAAQRHGAAVREADSGCLRAESKFRNTRERSGVEEDLR